MQSGVPESWKTKCGIRRADEVAPLTDGGTLIMRRSPFAVPTPRAATAGSTMPSYRHDSMAPFAVDVEETLEPPARNSDVLGLRYKTLRDFDTGRSTSRTSRFLGVMSGVMALGVGAMIAFASFTDVRLASGDEGSATMLRERRSAVHLSSKLTVESPDSAETKAEAPKPRRKHRKAAAAVDSDAPAAAEAPLDVPVSAPAPAPQPSDSE